MPTKIQLQADGSISIRDAYWVLYGDTSTNTVPPPQMDFNSLNTKAKFSAPHGLNEWYNYFVECTNVGISNPPSTLSFTRVPEMGEAYDLSISGGDQDFTYDVTYMVDNGWVDIYKNSSTNFSLGVTTNDLEESRYARAYFRHINNPDCYYDIYISQSADTEPPPPEDPGIYLGNSSLSWYANNLTTLNTSVTTAPSNATSYTVTTSGDTGWFDVFDNTAQRKIYVYPYSGPPASTKTMTITVSATISGTPYSDTCTCTHFPSL